MTRRDLAQSTRWPHGLQEEPVPELADEALGGPSEQEVTQLLLASRALVRIAARSVAPVEHTVTLPQYRLLLRLHSGAQSGVQLAEDLGVNPSTIVRMVDRLEAKGLLTRTRGARDRRIALISLTAAGADLIDGVTARRRADLHRALERLGGPQRTALIDALALLNEEPPPGGAESWPL